MDQAETLVDRAADAVVRGLREIGAGDATVINTGPVEELCKSLDGIANALQAIADAINQRPEP